MDVVFKDLLSVFAQEFLSVVLPVLFSALAGLVVVYVKKGIDQIKANVSEDLWWALEQAAASAVKAAEQVGLQEESTDKLSYAVDYATGWLKMRGYKIDLALIEAAIEAAVWEELNKTNPYKNESLFAEQFLKNNIEDDIDEDGAG